jgi:hypothetical protein
LRIGCEIVRRHGSVLKLGSLVAETRRRWLSSQQLVMWH